MMGSIFAGTTKIPGVESIVSFKGLAENIISQFIDDLKSGMKLHQLAYHRQVTTKRGICPRQFYRS